MFRTWTLTPSFCAFSLSSGVCMPYVWHRRFPMTFLVGKKFCSCEGGNTKWNKGTAWEQLTQRVTDNERVEVEVWWMMMDDRGQGEKKKKKKTTYKFRMQITGDAMHSWRLSYDPVKEIGQWRKAASCLSIGTDWGCATPRGKLQVHQCYNCKPNWGAKTFSSSKNHNGTWKQELGFVHLAILPFLMAPFLQWTIGGCVQLFSHQSYSFGSELVQWWHCWLKTLAHLLCDLLSRTQM